MYNLLTKTLKYLNYGHLFECFQILRDSILVLEKNEP